MPIKVTPGITEVDITVPNGDVIRRGCGAAVFVPIQEIPELALQLLKVYKNTMIGDSLAIKHQFIRNAITALEARSGDLSPKTS